MNKLSRYIIIAAVVAIVCFLVWYFSEIVWYILIAAVISLIGKPIVKFLTSFSIKKFKIPNWLASILALVFIFAVIGGVLFFIAPLFGRIINEVGQINFEGIIANTAKPLAKFNRTLIKTFPSLGRGFKVEVFAIEQLKGLFNISLFSKAFSSLASGIIDFFIGAFSVIFISFFLLQEKDIISNVMSAIVPDKYEDNMQRALASIDNLLVRYFTGIFIESILIMIINMLGLHFIAGMDFYLAATLGFASGILNVIPYVGPLSGEVLGVLTGLITHYSAANPGPVLPYLITILAIMLITQLIDNYVFQPYIYSSSVKAHPLEIFIVILIAGYIGGIVGMLVAIPAYTVLRVFASEFLSRFKIVQELTKSIKGEAAANENVSKEDK
ncbi:MAG: AI-2E family transporter [Bacteroidales bacterium]|nr:AI-2E family transporter [Bacteroidales bacterium]MDD3201612.1 AI-2E family transporter [Bacteroidales bacterium]